MFVAPLIALELVDRFCWIMWRGMFPQDFIDGTWRSANQLIQRSKKIQELVIQRVQAHVTLFSKFFASFPYGTCSLSDSRSYLALDAIYHLLDAPIPGNATLETPTLRHIDWVLNRTVTILHTSFQKIYTHRVAHHTWWRFKTGATLLWNMGLSFFIRHYYKNPISFLFHHLLICLNSEGNINHTGPLVSLTLAYKCIPESSRKPNRCSCE